MTTRSVLASILLIAAAGPFRLSAQTIKVNSANPNSYEQGTTSLDVTIGGSGFAKGAKSSLNLTGTTDTGGVTVNSTSFISSNQLTANITVPTTAVIGSYDILVTNTNGRTGKGTGLASVISNKVCTLSPLPSGITLVGTMNPVAAFSGGLGSAIRMRHMKVGAKDVLVAGVGSSASGNLEVFFLDAATGNVLDGTNIFSGTSPQPHITKPINYTGFGARNLAMGDLNADGVPDIVMADWDYGVAFAFVGSLSANGIVGYSGPIAFPSVPGRSLRFGTDTSMSDMDGLPGDEVVVADGSYSDKRNKQTGGVFVFKYNNGSPGDAGSFNLLWYMGNPASSAAIGDVTGDSNVDVIRAKSGSAYVYPGPTYSSVLTLNTAAHVSVARVFGGPYNDLVVGASVFRGPVVDGQQPTVTVSPVTGLSLGWGTGQDVGDVNNDGFDDLLQGAPNTQPSNVCPNNVGTAYVYLTDPANPSQPTMYVLEPPDPGADYGWGMGAGPGTKIFAVGEIGRTINGVIGAGQVWIYRFN